MQGNQILQLEKSLWDAADHLRANSKLTASEYSMPVLGLIFLRHSDSKFKEVKALIEADRPVHPERGVLPATKAEFLAKKVLYLPPSARFEYLASLPEEEDICKQLDDAMRLIEEENPVLEGVLPKEFHKLPADVLRQLIRSFTKDEIKDLKGDVFGRIYEYFLGNFAMNGAQEGGEFFTPVSLVQTIVNVIEPEHGIVLDPAVGSAGMFVQTGHFIEDKNLQPEMRVRFYGQEKTELNTRLARMNMAVHGLEGDIQEANSFYDDRFELVGKCDFVMANPPFNVDGVDKKKIVNDSRLPFGIPKNDNANYLWIQYFYSYLNETGRAGFVMAASASDAGHSEKEIRRQLVESGAVDVMISIGTNFFYTVTLPCTLWFFDRGKENDENRSGRTLMIDARPIFRVVTRKINDFSPEQLTNITSIVHLYRGEHENFKLTVGKYFTQVVESLESIPPAQNTFKDTATEIINTLKPLGSIHEGLTEVCSSLSLSAINEFAKKFESRWESIQPDLPKIDGLYTRYEILEQLCGELETGANLFDELLKTLESAFDGIKKLLKSGEIVQKSIPGWKSSEVKKNLETLNSQKKDLLDIFSQVRYFLNQIEWLKTRFPEGIYQDIPGLCRIVTLDEIISNDCSLTPGRYVGIQSDSGEDFDFNLKIQQIHSDLLRLDNTSRELADIIRENLGKLVV